MLDVKIGLSGLNSTGKTTLSNALASHLGWTVVQEGVPRSLFSVPAPQQARLLLEYVQSKREAQNTQAPCILDRTAIDIALMIFNRPEIFGLEAALKAYAECEIMAQELDALILLPHDAIAVLESPNEAGLIRRFSPLMRKRNDILLRGLAQSMHDQTTTWELPNDVLTVEERVSFVVSRIEKLSSVNANPYPSGHS